MGSAVLNLQKAIVQGNQSLTQLLQQTKLIAAKLNLADVETWVDYELKGYPKGIELPKYREVITSHLEVRNPVHGWDFAGNLNLHLPIPYSISEIETLSKGAMATTTLSKKVPVRDSLGTGLGCDWSQRVAIPGTEFKKVAEAVRNKLLEWSIELEKRGIKGEDMEFNENEKQSATNQVFNIQNVTGIVGNVQDFQVTLYDYGTINQLLIDHKVPKQDRRELEDIMDELKDAPPDKKPSLIKRGKAWVVKHKGLLGTAAEAVGKAINSAMEH